MNGEKTPCIPSLVPVVQLAQPGKLLGRMVERRRALTPSRISRDRTGKLPAVTSGFMMSNVAPSRPMITVFIYLLPGLIHVVEEHLRLDQTQRHKDTKTDRLCGFVPLWLDSGVYA